MTRGGRTSGNDTKARRPPITLCGCRVEQSAVCDRSFSFSGHGLLFVNGRDLGPVPRLALARERSGEVQLLHCDTKWNVLGVSVHPDIRTAKKRAERFYPGISRAWRRTGYSQVQANRQLERIGANRTCAICRKPWWDVEGTIEVPKAGLTLCVGCVRGLYELSTETGSPTGIVSRPKQLGRLKGAIRVAASFDEPIADGGLALFEGTLGKPTQSTRGQA